jgi:transposase
LPERNGKEQQSMARRRIGMKALRQVIELHENTQFSNRQIAAATGVSRPAVADYIAAYSRSGLSWNEFSTLTDTQAIARLSAAKDEPDERLATALEFFPYMLTELSRVGMTRDILWREYRTRHPDGFHYSQFCTHFRAWCHAETEVTLSLAHKAGDRMYVDFSGVKRSYRENGVEREAELFIAILGASQYTYVEALRSQRKEDFIMANRNALLFFGGVPAAIVPDCLKSAVSKADKYESEINPEYADFARHHDTVIFPARPHSPRDKALVEGAVNIMYTRFIARIARTPLLILDDFGLVHLGAQDRLALLEIVEDRLARNATIIATQIPVAQWFDVIGDPTIADAVCDRIVPQAIRIPLTGMSIRALQGQRETTSACVIPAT